MFTPPSDFVRWTLFTVFLLTASVRADDYSLIQEQTSELSGGSYFEPVTMPATATTSQPRFSATVDILVLERVDGLQGDFFYDANSFDFFNPATYQPLGGIDNISDEAKPGFRVNLESYNEDGTSTELSFFQMEKFGEPYTVRSDDPITYVFFFTVPANPQNRYDLDYSSRFRGIELNRKRQFGSYFTGIAGLRYVQLSESFNINSNAGSNSSKIDNELYGLQLGGDLTFFRWRQIEFGAVIKGGIYLNHAHVSAATVRASNNQPARFVDNEDEVAFVGETLIGAFIPMGPAANLRIGYQMYYLDGIGLAPNQVDDYSLFAQFGSMDTQDLWFHGGYVGIELAW